MVHTVPKQPASDSQALGEWFFDVTDEVCATLPGGAVVVIAQLNPLAELDVATTTKHARLIAAAPDLLAALQAWVFEMDNTAGSIVPRAVRAAILKATANAE